MEQIAETVQIEKYPAYKNSGVTWLGEVPDHWEISKVKFQINYQKGKNPKSVSLEPTGDIYLSMDYLRGKNQVIQYVNNKRDLIEVDDDELLLLWDGANAGEFINGKHGILSSTMALITVKSANIRYSKYFFKTIETQLRAFTVGMGIPHVNGNQFSNLLFLLPTLAEQTTIANFLDRKTAQIDRAIAQKEKLIELLKERKQVLIHRAAMRGLNPDVPLKDSGVEWIGEVPKHWDVKRLKYLFTVLKRIAGQLGHDVLSITQTGIKVKDVESGGGQLAMDYSKYQLIYKGDFAMNHMDLLTGYVDISKFDGVISPDYRVFELINSKLDKQYFLLLLQLCYKNKVFYAHGQGVSMLGRWRFPTENFNNFLFPVPPPKEQVQISEYIFNLNQKIDNAISAKEKEIEKLKEYKASLINSAVTGKIKVA